MEIKDIEFLKESNAIEREYSDEALQDSKQAWTMACISSKEFASIAYILGIHRRIMKRLNPKIAGKIRDCNVWIGGECRNQSKKVIEQQLRHWNKNFAKKTTEKGIKTAHIQFEKIHPFEDGNGRVGRILMNVQRIKAKLPILIIHEGKEQQKYYQWFRSEK